MDSKEKGAYGEEREGREERFEIQWEKTKNCMVMVSRFSNYSMFSMALGADMLETSHEWSRFLVNNDSR